MLTAGEPKGETSSSKVRCDSIQQCLQSWRSMRSAYVGYLAITIACIPQTGQGEIEMEKVDAQNLEKEGAPTFGEQFSGGPGCP